MSAPNTPRDHAPIANDWTLAFTHPLTREASDYWERCRGDRAMPLKRDLTLRGMRNFLSHVALIDVLPRVHGEFDFRVRLAGEATKRVFGNVAGKSFGEFLTAEGEQRWRLGAEAVCARKARLRSHGSVTFEDKTWLDFETLLAPLGVGAEVQTLFTVFVSWSRATADY